jgi:hypothetical protein
VVREIHAPATVLAVPEVFTALFQRLRGYQHCPDCFGSFFCNFRIV